MDAHAHVGKQPIVKVSKQAAGYEHPAAGEDHCALCTYFERMERDHCSRVKGIILADDWCRLFKGKE